MTAPLPKLNKRLIWLFLMVAAIIAIPLMVFPMMSSNKAVEKTITHRAATPAQINPNDTLALSGTERFPKNYGELKGFEQEIAKEAVHNEEEFVDALKQIEEKNKVGEPQHATSHGQHHYGANEDPWLEAKRMEMERRASEHFEAKRSDIMFIDHHDRKPKSTADSEEDDHTLSRAHKSSAALIIGAIKEPVPFMVSQGTLIPAILQSEIDTSLPGPILARVSQNIWDSKTGKILLIPQNSTLIGEYNSTVGHGQSRAQIMWQRIIFPNQQSVDLGAMVGVDKKGTSGTAGTVDNHYDKVALGLFLSTALGATMRMTQGKYDPNSASIGQDLGNSFAQESARLGNKIVDRMLSMPPTIKVPMGQRLNVFVEQDLSLRPYQG